MEFLKKYGLESDDIYTLLTENDKDYIMSFTEEKIDGCAEILKKYKIDFIGELIMADIGIFAYNPKDFELKILKMMKKLGPNYLEIINDDIGIVIENIYNN